MKGSFLFCLVFFLGVVSAQNTAWDFIKASGSHTMLTTFLTQTGLNNTLATPGAVFTVFAPTDTAFMKLNFTLPQIFAAYANTTQSLTGLLLYHVVGGYYNTSNIINNQKVNTSGVPLISVFGVRFNKYGTVFTVNGARITAANNAVSNGVVHVVESVVIPPFDPANPAALAAFPQLSTLFALSAGATSAFSDVTVFAPLDTAFTAFNNTYPGFLSNLANIPVVLTAHIGIIVQYSAGLNAGANTITTAAGTQLTLNVNSPTSITIGPFTANVVLPDLPLTIGTLWVVDKVLYTPTQATTAQVTTATQVTTGVAAVTGSPATSGAAQFGFSFLTFFFALLMIKFM